LVGSALLLEEAIAEVRPEGPFSIALASEDGIASRCGGHWPSGAPVLESDLFYGASLGKQITGVAVALLVADGLLDLEKCVAAYLPHAGQWTDHINARHLLHHVSGLPMQGALEAGLQGNWTADGVMQALSRISADQPGRSFSYSNAGYVVLAEIVRAIAGIALPKFFSLRIGQPFHLESIQFADGPGNPPSKQWSLLGPHLPLTWGDGGMWTSAGAFAAWLTLQNRNLLAVEPLVTADYRLNNGECAGYGWGLGIRKTGSLSWFVHGGSWQGAYAKAIRCPMRDTGLVGLGVDPAVVSLVDNVSARLLG